MVFTICTSVWTLVGISYNYITCIWYFVNAQQWDTIIMIILIKFITYREVTKYLI